MNSKLHIFLFVLSVSSLGCNAKESTSSPVSWNSRELSFQYVNVDEASSISDLSRLLTKKWGEGLIVESIKNNDIEKVEIRSCKNLLDVIVYDAVPSSDFQYISAWSVSCYAIDRLIEMQPYYGSYIGSEVKDLINSLAGLSLTTVPQADHDFLHDLNHIHEIKCRTKFSCNITGDNYKLHISVLAEGDLNKDGVKDMILKVSYGSMHVSAKKIYGIVITKQPDEKLELLDVYWKKRN